MRTGSREAFRSTPHLCSICVLRNFSPEQSRSENCRILKKRQNAPLSHFSRKRAQAKQPYAVVSHQSWEQYVAPITHNKVHHARTLRRRGDLRNLSKNRLTSQRAHRTAATPASDDLRVHRTQASVLSSRLTRLIAAPRPRVTYAANLTMRCWPASHKLHRQRLTSTLRTSRPSKIKYSTLFHYTSYVTCA